MNIATRTLSYRKIMTLMIVLFVTVLFGYAILMNAVVSTSKKLVKLEESIISMQTKITQAEHEIVSLRKSVTKEGALAQGFVESSQVAYVKTDGTMTAFLNE